MSAQREIRIREIQDNFFLVLCDYIPKCKKRGKCNRAHNKEELEAWKDVVIHEIRPFQSNFQLKLCSFGTARSETTSSQYCHGLSCMFAHSKEELESWKPVGLDCRESSGKILEMCRFAKKCSNGGKCRYAHHKTELEAWNDEHYERYVMSPTTSLPERCTYTTVPPSCQQGVACPYAHTDEEKDNLIVMLGAYDKTKPRPVPRVDKLLPYTLCENRRIDRKSKDGECIYGEHCKQAHSQEELDSWEAQRKEVTELKTAVVHPFLAGVSKLKICLIIRRRRAGRCGDENCPYAHSKDELEEWMRKEKSPMIGLLGRNGQDPFLVSLIDYQRRFSDQLAAVLSTIVLGVNDDPDIKDKLGSFIDHSRTRIDINTEEGQQSASLHDLQYLLGYLKRNSLPLSEYFGIQKSSFVDVLSDLLEVRNALAHGMYKENSKEEVDKTQRFIMRGIGLVENLNKKHKASEGFSELLKTGSNFRDFISYQAASQKTRKEFKEMTAGEKKITATETLKNIQDLLENDEDLEVTEFIAVYLKARFGQR